MQIFIGLHERVAVPAWEALPYSCMDDFFAEMLPRCAAHTQSYSRPADQHCWLCPPPYQQGTLQHLLEILPTWTRPLKYCSLAIQSPLPESIGVLSRETQKVWEEISRLVSLSISGSQVPVVDVHVNGLGSLLLGGVYGVFQILTMF